MRNLKRALSLTLASVMLLGMMVVGSSAASYPDVEDTHNVEAIEVLKTIKVMVGDDNGNFGPDDQVNRAQMAVVMALLLDLDYDYYKGTNPFWDVPSWAEPYVAACYANGIVSGYNATTYGSGDPVTAVQAASMMMRALGYFKYQSDYKDGFELATVRQASKIGLFKDVNAASNNTALTRNQVAQLALNTLETAVVDAKDNTLSINTGANAGNISITGGQVDYIVRTSNDTKVSQAIDKVDKGGTETDGRQGWTVELGEQLFQGDLKKDADTDDFERPATRWTYKFSEIGTYADTPDYTYTTSISGDTPADKVKNMGLKGYKWDGVYYENGAKNNTTCTSGSDDAARLGKLAADVAADGVLIEVYMDDDNTDTIERVTVIYTQMMQVNAVSSSEITLKKLDDNERDNGNTVALGSHSDFITVKTVKEDDAGYNVLKNLKTDDYVLIVPVADNSQYKVASAVVPETASGVLEAINTKSTDGKVKSIKVAGETYKMSNTWTSEDDEMHRGTKLNSKLECQVYLDIYGNAIYVKNVQANNAAVIVDYIYSAVENGKIVKYVEGWDSTGNEITLNLGTSPNFHGYTEAQMQGKVFEYATSSVNDADYALIKPALTWADGDSNIVYQYSKDGTNVLSEKADASDADRSAASTVNYGDYSAKVAGYKGAAATDTAKPYDSAVKFIFISTESGVGSDVTGITVKTGVSEVKPYTPSGGSKVYPGLTYILNNDRTKIVAVVINDDNDAGNTTSLLYLEAITGHENNANNKRVAYATIWIDGEQSKDVMLSKDYDGNAVDQFYTYSESNGVYTLTPYNKTTKVTSVKCGQVLTSTELSKGAYWFQGVSQTLNAKDAKVFDLYGADGKFYDTVKGMQDAINNDVSEKTNSPIVNFKVSYIYNGDSGDSGYNTVKYLFITESNNGVTPSDPGPGPGGDETEMPENITNVNLSNAAAVKITYTGDSRPTDEQVVDAIKASLPEGWTVADADVKITGTEIKLTAKNTGGKYDAEQEYKFDKQANSSAYLVVYKLGGTAQTAAPDTTKINTLGSVGSDGKSYIKVTSTAATNNVSYVANDANDTIKAGYDYENAKYYKVVMDETTPLAETVTSANITTTGSFLEEGAEATVPANTYIKSDGSVTVTVKTVADAAGKAEASDNTGHAVVATVSATGATVGGTNTGNVYAANAEIGTAAKSTEISGVTFSSFTAKDIVLKVTITNS